MGVKYRKFLVTTETRDKYRFRESRIIKATSTEKLIDSIDLGYYSITFIFELRGIDDGECSSK